MQTFRVLGGDIFGGELGRSRGAGGVALASLDSMILAHNPNVYWRLGENSGTTAEDSSGNNVDATYVGAPTLGATGVSGASGDKSVTLNGSSQYLSVADLTALETAISGGTPIDVVFHFKTTSTARQALIGTVSTTPTLAYIAINDKTAVETAGWVTVRICNEAGQYQTIEGNPGAAIYDGEWHQLRVRIDTSGTGNHAIWFDGSRYATVIASSARGTLSWTHDWYIGARNNQGTADWLFDGTLDEIVICPPLSLLEAEVLRRRAIENTASLTPAFDTTPTLALSRDDIAVGWDSLYWTRPYIYPDAVGGGDEYLWLGSTDHTPANTVEGMYRGFSASPATMPTAWTTFLPHHDNAALSQEETPFFVHVPGDARPYRLYWHSFGSESGGNQNSRLTSHTGVAWESGTDDGEMLPSDVNISPTEMDHTGYMSVERRAADDWHAWSFVRAFGTHGRAEYGYWASSDGLTWTIVNDDLDVRTMLPAVRQLVVRSLNRFVYSGKNYAIVPEYPDAGSTGDNNADPGGQLLLCEMPDEQTFVPVMRLWEPIDHALTDNLRDVRIYQDDDDASLIHLYIHIARTSVYYATIDLDPPAASEPEIPTDWWLAGGTIDGVNALEHVENPDIAQLYSGGLASGAWTIALRTASAGSVENYLFDSQTGRLIVGRGSGGQNGFYTGAWNDIGLLDANDSVYFVISDGASIQAYRNNVAVGSAVSSVMDLGGNLTRWRSHYTGATFTWTDALPAAAVYNVALTPVQRAALYEAMAAL